MGPADRYLGSYSVAASGETNRLCAPLLSKVQSVDQRNAPLECGVGFRQLRTCRRTGPGSYVPTTDLAAAIT